MNLRDAQIKTIIRYSTWVVIILSMCMFFMTIFASVFVGAAGHSSGSSAELSVFNEAYPLPKNAVKGDAEVMKLLQN